jgi:hypothetical protein
MTLAEHEEENEIPFWIIKNEAISLMKLLTLI